MSRNTDVLVIGAGVVGICSAHFLRAAGREVTVIDKGEVCSGSSYGNAGLLCPSSSIPLPAPGVVRKGLKWMFLPESPFYIKPRFDIDLIRWLWNFRRACSENRMRKSLPVIRDLSLASLRLYEELAALEGFDFGFEKRGGLMLFETEKGFEEGRREARIVGEVGIETRVLNPSEVGEMQPNLRANVVGAIFYPQDAHVIPDRFVNGLAGHIMKKGVDIRTSTEVLGFKRAGRNLTSVKTTRGYFRAREIVLAGGSWASGMAKELQIRLPIQPAKGYSITVRRPDGYPATPVMLAEAKVGVTPMGDSLRFAGTLELAGLNLSINMRRVNALLKAVRRCLPEWDPRKMQLREIWRGLRPCTPDGLPFLGRSRAYDNLTVAAGHAMIGLSLGPITGKLVAQIVLNEKPDIDISLLAVERFD